jgi:hypothetical protein
MVGVGSLLILMKRVDGCREERNCEVLRNG